MTDVLPRQPEQLPDAEVEVLLVVAAARVARLGPGVDHEAAGDAVGQRAGIAIDAGELEFEREQIASRPTTKLWRRSSFVGPSSTDRSSGLVAAPPPTPLALLLDVAFDERVREAVRSLVPRYSVRVCKALYLM